MNREQIMEVIRELARSQGFYGRLYQDFCYLQENEPETLERIFEELEAQKFVDTLDVVLYFER